MSVDINISTSSGITMTPYRVYTESELSIRSLSLTDFTYSLQNQNNCLYIKDKIGDIYIINRWMFSKELIFNLYKDNVNNIGVYYVTGQPIPSIYIAAGSIGTFKEFVDYMALVKLNIS